MTGQSEHDCTTLKYNSAGVVQWIARYDGPGGSRDWPAGIAVDDSGNIYFAGYSDMMNGAVYTTIKYIQGTVLFGIRADVNGDTRINILDVVGAVRHIVGIRPLEGSALWRADCNGDGRIDAGDVLGIAGVMTETAKCHP